MHANIIRFELPDSGEVSGLGTALATGAMATAQIVAVIGKNHGNDYTKGNLTLTLSLLIAAHTGDTPGAGWRGPIAIIAERPVP